MTDKITILEHEGTSYIRKGYHSMDCLLYTSPSPRD